MMLRIDGGLKKIGALARAQTNGFASTNGPLMYLDVFKKKLYPISAVLATLISSQVGSQYNLLSILSFHETVGNY